MQVVKDKKQLFLISLDYIIVSSSLI